MNDVLVAYRDDGPLVSALLGRGARTDPAPALAWVVPPALRALEYGLVLAVAVTVDGAGPSAYALLAAVAFHHYDMVYRVRHQGSPPPRWVRFLGGGWELRSLVVVAGAVAGVAGPTLAVAAAWCAVWFVSESVASWVRTARVGAPSRALGDEEDDFG